MKLNLRKKFLIILSATIVLSINHSEGKGKKNKLYISTIKVKGVSARYHSQLTDLKNSVNQRKNSIRSVMMGIHEKSGDTAYREYNFNKAKIKYEKAALIVDSIQNFNVQAKHNKRLMKKLIALSTTGKSYLVNKVKTYMDLAEFYNLKDESDNAKDEKGIEYDCEITICYSFCCR